MFRGPVLASVFTLRSEIGNNSFRDQSSENNDGRFYRDADDEGVNEELRDELFADGELNSLL